MSDSDGRTGLMYGKRGGSRVVESGPSPKQVEQTLQVQALLALHAAMQTQTITLERLVTGPTNHVLECSLRVIPAEGFITFEWGLPCGSVAVMPHTPGSTLTVVSGSSTSGAAPASGNAMGLVQAPSLASGMQPAPAVFNLSSHAITVYGTAGDKFTLQAFTQPMPPR